MNTAAIHNHSHASPRHLTTYLSTAVITSMYSALLLFSPPPPPSPHIFLILVLPVLVLLLIIIIIIITATIRCCISIHHVGDMLI